MSDKPSLSARRARDPKLCTHGTALEGAALDIVETRGEELRLEEIEATDMGTRCGCRTDHTHDGDGAARTMRIEHAGGRVVQNPRTGGPEASAS